MTESIRLSQLVPERLDSVAEQVRARICDNEQVAGMKLAWDYIGKELGESLRSVLDCDLIALIAGGWAKAAELAAFADPDKHPPGERSIVELGEHDFSRELHPVIAVTIAACPCIELTFDFGLTAHVGGVRLSILDGHIIGGDLGELSASAQLSYQGTPLHPPRESTKIAMPGNFSFAAPGIRIPRRPA
ncbi:MAG: hypothetical protein ABIO43_13055 [Sphingomicrobium sp.]